MPTGANGWSSDSDCATTRHMSACAPPACGFANQFNSSTTALWQNILVQRTNNFSSGTKFLQLYFFVFTSFLPARARTGSRCNLPRSSRHRRRREVRGADADVAVEIGRTRMSLAELHRLTPGDALVLERPMATRLPLTVAGRVVARGQPVAVEEHFALKVETGPDDLPP